MTGLLSVNLEKNLPTINSTFNFSEKYITQSIHQSLKNLQTDYIDIMLIHSNGMDVEIINNHQVFMTLDKLKQQGLIRSFGMSTKTIDGGLLTIKHADIVMASLIQ